MSKILSLKLREDIFHDAEAVMKKMQIPRDTTKLNHRSQLRKQLVRESKLVSANSMAVLKEFELFIKG